MHLLYRPIHYGVQIYSINTFGANSLCEPNCCVGQIHGMVRLSKNRVLPEF